MSARTKIEWTDTTWNVVVGCSKVSEGCRSCYAIRDAWRLAHNPKLGIVGGDESVPHELLNPYRILVEKVGGKINWTGDLHFFEERLNLPTHLRRASKIFINSLSDLFHERLSFERVDQVFHVAARNDRHDFQVLTKRSERMKNYSKRMAGLAIGEIESESHPEIQFPKTWPLPNVWLGVTVENEETAAERIPALIDTPAAVRWISYEPALGPINWKRWLKGIDWVVCGGESGPGARPMQPEWARAARDACEEAGVPYFFKQWGGKKKAGRVLDGRTHNDFPKSRIKGTPKKR